MKNKFMGIMLICIVIICVLTNLSFAYAAEKGQKKLPGLL